MTFRFFQRAQSVHTVGQSHLTNSMEEYVGSKGASDERRSKDVKKWNSPLLVCSSRWGKKTPKAGTLTNNKHLFLTILEAGSTKIEVSAGIHSLEAPGKVHFLAFTSLQRLLTLLGLWSSSSIFKANSLRLSPYHNPSL